MLYYLLCTIALSAVKRNQLLSVLTLVLLTCSRVFSLASWSDGLGSRQMKVKGRSREGQQAQAHHSFRIIAWAAGALGGWARGHKRVGHKRMAAWPRDAAPARCTLGRLVAASPARWSVAAGRLRVRVPLAAWAAGAWAGWKPGCTVLGLGDAHMVYET